MYKDDSNDGVYFNVTNDEVKGRACTSECACRTSRQAVEPHCEHISKTGSIRRHVAGWLDLEMTME